MKTLKVEAGENKQKHKHLKFYLFFFRSRNFKLAKTEE